MWAFTNNLDLLYYLLLFTFFTTQCSFNESQNQSKRDIIIQNAWYIESIIEKNDAHNPDDSVTGKDITKDCQKERAINFIENGNIEIDENDFTCIWGGNKGLIWILDEEDNYITFRRLNDTGNTISQFGYHIKEITKHKLTLYSMGVGIESGEKYVKIMHLISG